MIDLLDNNIVIDKSELETLKRLKKELDEHPNVYSAMGLKDYTEDLYTKYKIRRDIHQINLETGEVIEVKKQ